MKLKPLTLWKKFFSWKLTPKGQTLVEYTLIIMLVGSVLFVLLTALGNPLKSFFGKVTTTLSTAY